MKLVANIKLLPTPAEAGALRRTLERANAACNWLSGRAFETGTLRQFSIHQLCYFEARDRFELTAQMAVRCIAKVADAYKAGRDGRRTFNKHAAQPYDARIVSFKADDIVSIWTLDGRLKIKTAMGKRQRELLAFRKGEVDLMLVRGNFYLACVCDLADPELIKTTKVLGVDFGIVNIATDSDGETYTGEAVEKVRSNLSRRRAGLQRRGTKAAKRRLYKLSKKQQRFQKHENHCISKTIVVEAQRSGRGIGLEELKHIRSRVKARRQHRARLSNWSFGQLRQFVAYKAQRAGIPVVFVNPRYTSKGCPECGTIDAKNRPSQAVFSCVSCGHEGHADQIAARNIRSRAEAALVTRP